MSKTPRTSLRRENEELRLRLAEAEQTLEAIRAGEVDSVVVEGPDGVRVYALESAGNSYRVLIEAMGEGAVTLTTDGVILYCNGRFARMLGRPLQRVMGSSLRDLVPERLHPMLEALLRAADDGESRSELALLSSGGEEVPAYLSVNAIDDGGRRLLCLVATDLRAQRRGEEILAAERFARSVLQQAAEAIVVCDETGKVIRASGVATQLCGHNPLLTPFDEAFSLTLDEPPAAGAGSIVRAALAGQSFRGAAANLARHGGELSRLIVSAAPVYGAAGGVVGCVVTMVDVTEQRRAEDALREADRRKNEFLGVLSHELRNPLAPIRNSIVLLDHAPPGSAQAAHAKEIIRRQTDHLSRLVDDLLDVTRISHGKVELERIRLDLGEVVRKVCDDHASIFAQGRVELRVEVPATPIWIDADRVRVSQVIGNLLQNAAKFTPAGGHVDVQLRVEGGRATIGVRDSGIGIDPRDLDRMFEPFAQADRSLARTRGGLGLGLALVKAVVELHGGSVRAQSEGVGRGSEFTVSLPLLVDDTTRSTEARTAATPAPGGRRILIIEDNVDAGRSLADLLEMSGHVVHVAYDGRSGIEKARQLAPDVLLCDIGLPDVDGYEVARVLRADGALRGTKLVALTGYALPEDKQRAKEAGFDAHLPKPPPIDRLNEVIARDP